MLQLYSGRGIDHNCWVCRTLCCLFSCFVSSYANQINRLFYSTETATPHWHSLTDVSMVLPQCLSADSECVQTEREDSTNGQTAWKSYWEAGWSSADTPEHREGWSIRSSTHSVRPTTVVNQQHWQAAHVFVKIHRVTSTCNSSIIQIILWLLLSWKLKTFMPSIRLCSWRPYGPDIA